MKKLSVVLVALLLVSWVTYGASEWKFGTNKIYAYPYSTTKVGIGVTSPLSKLQVSYNRVGPISYEELAAVCGYNSGNDQSYHNPIGVYGKVNASDGRAIFGQNLNSNGYGGYFQGRGYFSGNVGIGTSVSPDYKLNIGGNTRVGKVIAGDGVGIGGVAVSGIGNGSGYQGGIYAEGDLFDFYAGSDNGISIFDGSVCIGTGSTGGNRLSVNGTVQMSGFKLTTGAQNKYVLTSDAAGNGTWQEASGGGGGLWSRGEGYDIYYDDGDGNVGIGTPSPQSKLAVNGTITAKEVVVTEDGWPDFVFADNYKIMPLDRLERHIKINKSLPGIPTEKEVLDHGVSLGEMQTKLLEKVEELTLYVINQNKELSELKKENEELKKTNEDLEYRISALEK